MMRYLLPIFVFAFLATGCASDRLSSNQDSGASADETGTEFLNTNLPDVSYTLNGLDDVRADLEELCSDELAGSLNPQSLVAQANIMVKQTSINEVPPAEDDAVSVIFDEDSFTVTEGEETFSGTWLALDEDTIEVEVNGMTLELDVYLNKDDHILYISLNDDFVDFDCTTD